MGLLLAFFLLKIKFILIPFIFSALVAYLLNPIVSYYESKGIKRTVVALLLYIFAIITIAAAIYFIVPIIIDEASNLRDNAPYYMLQIKYYVEVLKEYILSLPLFNTPEWRTILTKEIFPNILETLSYHAGAAPKHIFTIASRVSLILLIPFISFFLLIRWKTIVNYFFDLIPSRYVETSLNLLFEIDEVLGRYIRGQLLDAMSVGIMATIGFSILRVDHAPIFGILVGLGNLIPYLGTIIGGGPAIVLVFLQTKSIAAVLKIIIMFIIVQFIDNNFIAPFIVGGNVKLHPVVILFALLVGAHFFGPIGMLLAVPFFCILKIIATIFIKHLKKMQYN